jgi:NCAIR mutase (PurE)-related protein
MKLLAVMIAGEDGAIPVTVRGSVDPDAVPTVTVPVSLKAL